MQPLVNQTAAAASEIDCDGCEQWSRQEMSRQMNEAIARMERMEDDLNRRPKDNIERGSIYGIQIILLYV